MPNTEIRTDEDLAEVLYDLWDNNFADIPRKNLVLIKFGKSSKRQLGSIKWVNKRTKVKGFLKGFKEERKAQDDKRISLITLTRLFQSKVVPDYVVTSTIAHELVHYTHGFHSPLQRRYKHPHQGRIVQKELNNRGLGEIHKKSEQWIKANWQKYAF